MRTVIFLGALAVGLAAYAQPQDTKERERAAEGASTKVNPDDPATKARVRAEGSAGGTGARIPDEASGGSSAGKGRQNRESLPRPGDETVTPPKPPAK